MQDQGNKFCCQLELQGNRLLLVFPVDNSKEHILCQVIALTGAVEQLCFGCDTVVAQCLPQMFIYKKNSVLLLNSYSTDKKE